MNNQDASNRRKFLKQSAGLLGGVLLASGIVPLGGCEELTEKNPAAPIPTGGVTITNGTMRIDSSVEGLTTLASTSGYALISGVAGLPEKILVFRVNATTVSALSELCTHQGCTVSPGSQGTFSPDRIVCPCHGSTFLVASGDVVKGPATIGLKQYPATVSGAIITVVLT